MAENFSKLKKQIEEINSLKNKDKWGPEYQLWKSKTQSLIKSALGNEALKLFNQQETVVTSYIDDDFNLQQYLKELDNRKKILEGLMVDVKENQSDDSGSSSDGNNILKEIWQNEEALKANLLITNEAQALQKSLIEYLEKTISEKSIPGLKLRKIKAEKRLQTWWSNSNGYPFDNPWGRIEPFLELLEQYETEKTIKKRLEIEGLFVESRSQGEDQHLLIGKRDGTGEKAHIIIDGKNGEIRVEDKQKAPEEVVAKIETFLTLPNGKKIKTSREVLEELEK